METNIREIVNGGQLGGFIGKKISITGFITEKNPNGMAFEIRAADNQIVKITLRRPLDRPIEGYIEVHGTSMGKEVVADEFVVFNNEKFDAKGHNKLCTLLTATTSKHGSVLNEPYRTPFGILKMIATVASGLLIGAAISKNIANFLEENDLFVPSDDDDDDD
ncbi:hypothetical protein NQ318_009033 [Aromia moschata]|uniref:Essential MCU regulator, mitochondrial n=1 Tax=Aromia moschata TaxID=1265417 RepID=A0AAV8YTQ7_9CUCU|nr:hypothetical protein NQ318_009033 [Aromia moschata]